MRSEEHFIGQGDIMKAHKQHCCFDWNIYSSPALIRPDVCFYWHMDHWQLICICLCFPKNNTDVFKTVTYRYAEIGSSYCFYMALSRQQWCCQRKCLCVTEGDSEGDSDAELCVCVVCLQEEYRSEGISWHNIEYIDNTGCINLISKKPTAMFHLLDEECKWVSHPDSTLYFPTGVNKHVRLAFQWLNG